MISAVKPNTTKLASLDQEPLQTFRPKTRPDIEIGLFMLKMEDHEIATTLLAERFSKTEAKYVHLGIPYEDVHKMILATVKRSIEDGGAVCAINLFKNTIIAVCACIDLYREIKEPLNLGKLFPEDAHIQKLFEFWECLAVPKEMEPKVLKLMWGSGFGATDAEYEQLSLSARTLDMIFKVTRGVGLGVMGNNRSTAAAIKLGWKAVKSISLKEYRDKKGNKVFEGIEETCQKLNITPFDTVHLMCWNTRTAEQMKLPTPKL